MKTYSKILVILFLTILILFLSADVVWTQCPMCRMSAESNLKDGGTEGSGLNAGILYMLSMPYLIVATLGFIWYKNRRQYTDQIDIEPFSDN